MSEALVIFKSINDSAEQEKLLQRLLQSKECITLKDKYDRLIILKAVTTNGTSLTCEFSEEAAMNLPGTELFMGSFQFGGDKYIFETRPVAHGKEVIVSLLNLFHLQKRLNYRYVLPSDYPAAFALSFVNETACQVHCRLLDLSTEGCAVEVTHDALSCNLEDEIKAFVHLGDREPILVQGLIKNIRLKSDNSLVLGVKFNHMAAASEDKIVSSITDLQREVYFRKAA
ncbi:PilZ domain-containing protein [Bdellovibrio reynosensis]|uniref:PilZ domain-containing protein n=1 Tax=Bdellovibrio reynosensis TaxID=2835041 RepID=A0ABY4CGF3_9BACT|nr:PilZ domain-containing protein [Bdellovibrio reynosensis]UOF01285.1 PilZ domain-containing protein [Bdellovibrio reynosensis]